MAGPRGARRITSFERLLPIYIAARRVGADLSANRDWAIRG
jgi:hypothetical protein